MAHPLVGIGQFIGEREIEAVDHQLAHERVRNLGWFAPLPVLGRLLAFRALGPTGKPTHREIL